MRSATASQLRRLADSGSVGAELADLPAPGTKPRLVYDMLYEHRGSVIPRDELLAMHDLLTSEGGKPGKVQYGYQIEYLRNYYGCDIRKAFRGKAGMSLVGEWHGRVYLDYTSPALEQAAS